VGVNTPSYQIVMSCPGLQHDASRLHRSALRQMVQVPVHDAYYRDAQPCQYIGCDGCGVIPNSDGVAVSACCLAGHLEGILGTVIYEDGILRSILNHTTPLPILSNKAFTALLGGLRPRPDPAAPDGAAPDYGFGQVDGGQLVNSVLLGLHAPQSDYPAAANLYLHPAMRCPADHYAVD